MPAFDPTVLQKRHNICLGNDIASKSESGFLLEDEAEFARLLDAFGSSIDSPRPKVTGSLFAKRYCSLIVGAIYQFTHQLYGLNLSLSNVTIVPAGGLLYFTITQPLEYRQCIQNDSFELNRETYFRHVFSDNVCRVFSRVVRHTGIQERNLWSALSYLLAYWKAEWVREAHSTCLAARIEEDYRYVTKTASPQCLGKKKENPLTCHFRQFEVPLYDERHILLREKCCLNYCLPGEDRYCYSCPLITHEQRVEKYLVAHEAKKA